MLVTIFYVLPVCCLCVFSNLLVEYLCINYLCWIYLCPSGPLVGKKKIFNVLPLD